MKKILLSFFGIVTIFLLFTSSNARAQKIERFSKVEGSAKEHFGTKEIPADILNKMLGLYKYEWTKEPIVELKAGNTGFFQTHGRPAYPIEYWMEVNEKGEPLMDKGEDNPNFRIVLIIKYGANSEPDGGVWNGSFGRIPVTFNIEKGKVDIYGERFKKL